MWGIFVPIVPEILKFWTETLLFILVAQKSSLGVYLDRQPFLAVYFCSSRLDTQILQIYINLSTVVKEISSLTEDFLLNKVSVILEMMSCSLQCMFCFKIPPHHFKSQDSFPKSFHLIGVM